MSYCERTDIESIYGANNVADWADLDRDQDDDKIAASITGAIADATDYLDDRFRDSRYVVPIVATIGGTPRQVKRLCARLAGLYLYEARGAQDINPETNQLQHRYRGVQTMVDQQIDHYLSGKMVLDATREDGVSSAPEVI